MTGVWLTEKEMRKAARESGEDLDGKKADCSKDSGKLSCDDVVHVVTDKERYV